MAIRKKIQTAGTKVSEKVGTTRDKFRERDDMASHTYEASEKLVKTIFKQLGQTAKWAVGKGASKIGSDEYRIELDAALQEALRVISVQEQRIALLESQISGK
jgi:hypothetical protein